MFSASLNLDFKVTGVLHADPHDANVIKVRTKEGAVQLGYLDFGILSTVPEQVRDALVCAVVQLVFNRDVPAVARLFGELQLLAPEVISDPAELQALTDALLIMFDNVLQYRESPSSPDTTSIPYLRFDALLAALFTLVARFEFKLPPYFLNNARALATLEGIARKLDPSFNVLQVLYPFALNCLLRASASPVVEETLSSCICYPGTLVYDFSRMDKLLRDSAAITGYTRLRVVRDILSTRTGWRIAGKATNQLLSRLIRKTKYYSKLKGSRFSFLRM